MGYNLLNIIREGLTGNKGWTRQWRKLEPRKRYDAIIIGGGAHGLATAYYLAKNHGITNIAVLAKGPVGGGDGGNAIVRANYHRDGDSEFYSYALKLWHNLSQELGYNVMMSERGVLELCHSPTQFDLFAHRGNAIMAQGDHALLMDRGMVQKFIPTLDFNNARFPIYGGLFQKTAGIASPDAVSWGYAHAADQLGIDLIDDCEVTGFIIKNGAIKGVDSTRGRIMAPKIGLSVPCDSRQLGALAGLHLPVERHVDQTFVTEPFKPFLDTVVSFGAGQFFIRQSNKGGLVFGGALEKSAESNDANQVRGKWPAIDDTMSAGMAMLPTLGRARVIRNQCIVLDATKDGSPIVDKTSIDGLYFNGGWSRDAFNATPAAGSCFAHLIAIGAQSAYARKFTLSRFAQGTANDE